MKQLSLKKLTGNHSFIDLRSAEFFAEGHLKGSINIPFSWNFMVWVKVAGPNSYPLVLIAPKEVAKSALEPLQMNGYTVLGYIPPENLSDEETLETISVTELANSDKYIIDVRTLEEWNEGHIKGSHHHELFHFVHAIDKIPKDKEIALICGGGTRSSVAASLLKRLEYPHVANVRGGMSAWIRARLPVD